MYLFWKKITLFGEILLFVPAFILMLLINNFQANLFITNLASFVHNYISFFTIEQISFAIVVSICILIGEIIGGAIKYFFFKERPKPIKWKTWFEKINAGSFPSLHSTRTFLLFLFAFYYTNFGFLFFIFWALIAYSRIYLKKHFPIDILGGVILASIIFFSIKSLLL